MCVECKSGVSRRLPVGYIPTVWVGQKNHPSISISNSLGQRVTSRVVIAHCYHDGQASVCAHLLVFSDVTTWIQHAPDMRTALHLCGRTAGGHPILRDRRCEENIQTSVFEHLLHEASVIAVIRAGEGQSQVERRRRFVLSTPNHRDRVIDT